MDDEAFKAATAGLTEQRDINLRQVANGFVLQSTSRYIQPNTGAIMVSRSVDAVAASADEAARQVTSFLTTGAFA